MAGGTVAHSRELRLISLAEFSISAWTGCSPGLQDLGIIQSLPVTRRLHGINTFDYLVNVLNRIDQQPGSAAQPLIPRP